ncbi:hypothetical protein BCR32DRAFT_211117 [Anaeromyces robustus]|uniref:Nucleotide-diphospho-sugar transferase domain-containing protein n=1 Tax=Anaeromyces robustus TaxID=1754192 RepID=A0A1Y1WG47_9FUNG|nr:hypothetical protein BCR32DRAFT_211117 [Anaeromyces robustus]|eukprot:ORX72521.1 hypothetical protein BCR32DRAFT_211117 [Anaeromyces robustus]
MLHHFLYPWLYQHHYRTFSDIITSSKGRGIVMCTGNEHFKYASSAIDIIRHVLNSDLPIEIFYNGDSDLSFQNRIMLLDYKDVYLTDISTYFDNSIVNISGWAIKPFAILASRFEEVILMDADVVYLRDPIELFEDIGYQKTGTLFFRDRTLEPGPHDGSQWLKSWMKNPLPETKKLRYWNELTQHEMDSSTVVIHKTKNILGLLAVCKLNEKKIRQEVIYKKVYGDKETFWMGFDMARQPYHMNTKPCTFIGELDKEYKEYYKYFSKNKICGHVAHQLKNGKLIFWNGSLAKEKRSKITSNDFIDYEVYFEDHGYDWDTGLLCIRLDSDVEIISLNDEDKQTINEIMEREKTLEFLTYT